jgi:hypothetical protein
MTTSDNVLDNIDHALHDWDTSADAMRWTPEPINAPQPTVMDITASMIRVAEVMRDAQEKLARAFTNMASQVVKIQAELRRLMAGQREAEAQIRRSAMRSEYHRRQKRRKR